MVGKGNIKVLTCLGIGNALKIFRERGMLGKNKFIGRNKDESVDKILASFGGDKT